MLLNLSCSVFEIVSQNVRLNFLNNKEFLIIFYVVKVRMTMTRANLIK